MYVRSKIMSLKSDVAGFVSLETCPVASFANDMTSNSTNDSGAFFTVNRLSVSVFSFGWNICGQWKKEGYLTHGVDALTEASDEGRRRLR